MGATQLRVEESPKSCPPGRKHPCTCGASSGAAPLWGLAVFSSLDICTGNEWPRDLCLPRSHISHASLLVQEKVGHFVHAFVCWNQPLRPPPQDQLTDSGGMGKKCRRKSGLGVSGLSRHQTKSTTTGTNLPTLCTKKWSPSLSGKFQ